MNSFQSQSLEMMDPNIIRKGIDDIKEQMKDMQREAHLIESDMEKRLQAIS